LALKYKKKKVVDFLKNKNASEYWNKWVFILFLGYRPLNLLFYIGIFIIREKFNRIKWQFNEYYN
jgi:hypothetical protein